MAGEWEGVTDVEVALLAGGEIDQLARLDWIEDHGLLDHDVRASQEGVFHQPVVRVVGRDHNDGIRLEGEEFEMVRERVLDSECVGGYACPLSVQVSDADHIGIGIARQARQVGMRSPPARANDSYSGFRHTPVSFDICDSILGEDVRPTQL
jgi:hypothetical protein